MWGSQEAGRGGGAKSYQDPTLNPFCGPLCTGGVGGWGVTSDLSHEDLKTPVTAGGIAAILLVEPHSIHFAINNCQRLALS